ncbi:hypothetical protein R6Z07F_005684 [Ovis aries]
MSEQNSEEASCASQYQEKLKEQESAKRIILKPDWTRAEAHQPEGTENEDCSRERAGAGPPFPGKRDALLKPLRNSVPLR